MLKAFDRTSVVIASLSLAAVWIQASKIDIGQTIQRLIHFYLSITHGIAEMIEPYLLALLSLFNVHVDLNDHWIHIVILLKLYFLAHVSSAMRDKLYPAARFYTWWGAAVALTAGVSTGALSLQNDADHALSFAIPVGAVALFATGNTLRSATQFRRADQTWWDAFGGPIRHVLRFLAVGLALLAAGLVWRWSLGRSSATQWGVLLLFAYTVCLALYRIWVNQSWVRGGEEMDRSWWDRVRYSRQAHIGWGMLATIVAASVVVAIGVGENILTTP